MVTKNTGLKKIFKNPPIAALRQTPNLRSLLCKSKLPMINENSNNDNKTQGWKNCFNSGKSKKPCKVCRFTFENTHQIVPNNTSYVHRIKDNLDCQTKNGIYYWKCTYKACKDNPCTEYVGKTKRTFLDRYYNHISYVRQGKLKEPSGKHFNKPGHNLEHMKGLLIERVRSNDPVTLKMREEYYIDKFDTFRNGLNKE